MFVSTLLRALSVALAVNPILGSFGPQGRMIDGISVDTLRRFPHHVLIRQYNSYCNGQWSDAYQGEWSYCGGSILNHRWVLTAFSCVQNFDALELSFQRMYLSKTNGSYSVVVNKDAIHVYPTKFDDIALIKLPSTLEITETVKPIDIYSGPNLAGGQFVVLSGYENSSSFNEVSTAAPLLTCGNQMVYGMFGILSAESCKAEAGKDFDEFSQYCTRPWDYTRNSPSPMDIGSGLILNWPARPQLVGIYIGNYKWNTVAVYTKVAKYENWIRAVITEKPVYS